MQLILFILLWTALTGGSFCLSLMLVEIGYRQDIEILGAVLGGLIIASAQALIFRRSILFASLWILSSFVAWGIISVTGIGALGWFVINTSNIHSRIIYGLILGALGGLGVGSVQWLLIRQYLPSAWRWILVSSICWAIGFATGSSLGLILYRFTQLFIGEVIGLALTWIIVGALSATEIYRWVNLKSIFNSN
ncbi:MAG: hypothetical protein QNJ49_08480 [Mastigocoleus sp. MO_167.B18]|nr:hypothetical protein [Mastigocoleus sp. MO_167.B18]